MDAQIGPCVIFIVENDEDDILILSYELQANGLEKDTHFFSDTNKLIDFHNTREQYPLPALILLSAFLPPSNIRRSVNLIKSVKELRTVPIVVMLGAQEEKEYVRSYNLNVSGYFIKPVNGQLLKRFLGIR